MLSSKIQDGDLSTNDNSNAILYSYLPSGIEPNLQYGVAISFYVYTVPLGLTIFLHVERDKIVKFKWMWPSLSTADSNFQHQSFVSINFYSTITYICMRLQGIWFTTIYRIRSIITSGNLL